MRMKCPYCKDFRGNPKVQGYPVKDQLARHIEVRHPRIGDVVSRLVLKEMMEAKP